MAKHGDNLCTNSKLSRFSFGMTAAIITSLAFIVGLSEAAVPTASIVGALLLIAIADNISDSLGIHVYRESQCSNSKGCSKVYTLSNFLSRFGVVMVFLAIVLLLPMAYALYVSVAFGIALLSVLSYMIAMQQKTSPLKAIIQHVGIAVIVLVASRLAGGLILGVFPL